MHSFRLRYIVLGLLIYIQSAFCRTCGSEFNDLTSRAYRAHAIFHGSVVRIDPYVPPPSWAHRQRRNLVNETRYYYATFRVRNRKLLKGSLLSWTRENAPKFHLVTVGVFGPLDKKRCVAPLQVGSNYIVFLQVSNSTTSTHSTHFSRRSNGSSSALSTPEPFSYRVSSLPEPMSKLSARKVRRSVCPNCVKKARAKLVPKRVSVLKATRLKLRCKTQGRPVPKVTWYKDNLLITKSRHIHIRNTKRGSVLKVKRAKPEDAGIYQCQAENVAGKSVGKSVVTIRAGGNTSNQPTHAVRCEQQNYCLNGGTCYMLKKLRTKFCKCSDRFVGTRCQNKEISAVINSLEVRNARMFDRTVTLWGLVVAALVFIAIISVAYFLARHKRKQFRKKKALKRQQALSSDGQVGGVHPEHAPILCQTAFEMNAMRAPMRIGRHDAGTQTPDCVAEWGGGADWGAPNGRLPLCLSPPEWGGRQRLSGVSATPTADETTVCVNAVVESDRSRSDSPPRYEFTAHHLPDGHLPDGHLSDGHLSDESPDEFAHGHLPDEFPHGDCPNGHLPDGGNLPDGGDLPDGHLPDVPVDTRSDMDVNVDTADDRDTPCLSDRSDGGASQPSLSDAASVSSDDDDDDGGEEERLLFQQLRSHPRNRSPRGPEGGGGSGGHGDGEMATPVNSWDDFPPLHPDFAAPFLYDPDPDATPV